MNFEHEIICPNSKTANLSPTKIEILLKNMVLEISYLKCGSKRLLITCDGISGDLSQDDTVTCI